MLDATRTVPGDVGGRGRRCMRMTSKAHAGCSCRRPVRTAHNGLAYTPTYLYSCFAPSSPASCSRTCSAGVGPTPSNIRWVLNYQLVVRVLMPVPPVCCVRATLIDVLTLTVSTGIVTVSARQTDVHLRTYHGWHHKVHQCVC